jgi:tetratricopeptide (TPR) repeat protein
MVSPSTYLFDGSGRLVALYQGRVDEGQIQADLGLAAPWDPVRRQNFAGLRPGRWIMPPSEELGVGFARVLKRRGLREAAQELEALAIKVRAFDMPGYLVELARARWQQGQREQAVASMRQALVLEGAASSNERRVQWLRSLASMETLMGHDGQALELWEQLIGIRPQDYAAWVGQGVILHRLGREADYTALLKELESKAPQFAVQLKSMVKDEAP